MLFRSQATPGDEFRAAVAAALDAAEREQGGWIVDGNYEGELAGLVRDRASIVVWFDLPRPLVMRRIILRTLRRALLRERLWNGNRERVLDLLSLDPERSIVRWAWTRHGVYRTRLAAGSAAAPDGQVAFGLVTIDRAARRVTVGSTDVRLTRSEFDLLEAMLSEPRRVYTRDELLDRVWGEWHASDDLTVMISRMRRKLAEAGAPHVIETVHGVGYRLSAT